MGDKHHRGYNMEEKKNRKTDLKVVDPKLDIVNWILKSATSNELEYLVALAKGGKFKLLISVVDKLTRKNIEDVFIYMAKDDSDLADFRAAKRGQVSGLRAFLIACQNAEEEMLRRKKKA